MKTEDTKTKLHKPPDRARFLVADADTLPDSRKETYQRLSPSCLTPGVEGVEAVEGVRYDD